MYTVMIFLHVLGVIVFAIGHGASVAVAFRMRGEREHARIAAMLDVSSWSKALMYWGLVITVVPGVVLGFMGGYWGTWWLWISIVLLVAVMGAMYSIATPAFRKLRVATGATLSVPSQKKAVGLDTEGAIEGMATSWRPAALAIIGGVGFAIILWLMIAQPI
jgi:hypothetical protein